MLHNKNKSTTTITENIYRIVFFLVAGILCLNCVRYFLRCLLLPFGAASGGEERVCSERVKRMCGKDCRRSILCSNMFFFPCVRLFSGYPLLKCSAEVSKSGCQRARRTRGTERNPERRGESECDERERKKMKDFSLY